MNFPADHFSTSLPLSRQWHDNVVYLYLLHCPNRACWFNVTCGRGLVGCQNRNSHCPIANYCKLFQFPVHSLFYVCAYRQTLGNQFPFIGAFFSHHEHQLTERNEINIAMDRFRILRGGFFNSTVCPAENLQHPTSVNRDQGKCLIIWLTQIYTESLGAKKR